VQASSEILNGFEPVAAIAVGQKSKIANTRETSRQDVQQKATDKLNGVESHNAVLVVLSVVLPAKADLTAAERLQAMVGDGDTVCVARQVLQDLQRPAEGRFGVDDPGSQSSLTYPPRPSRSCGKIGQAAVKHQGAAPKGLVEMIQELAAKEPAHHTHGQEEVGSAGDPAPAVRADAASWDNAMQVWMVLQILAPGVQDGHESDLGTEVPRIACQHLERLGRGPKEDAVDLALVL
jgi:hypothetical protein